MDGEKSSESIVESEQVSPANQPADSESQMKNIEAEGRQETADSSGTIDPPDGGTRAWLVMISSFFCLGLIFGLVNSYSVIYSYLQWIFASSNDPEASSKAALIGSITFGSTLFFSPIAGMLGDKLGLPFTTLIGGVTSVLGLMLSSLAPWNATVLFFTYGLLLGLGSSLVYTPTLSVLGIYFKRHLGKVNGFVCSGASVFTILMPPSLAYILSEYNLATAFRVLAACFCVLIVAAFVYRPMRCPKPREAEGTSKSAFNVDIWKQRPYIIWTMSCAFALSGYYVSYVHMVKFVEINFPGRNTSLPVMCIGAASGIGRLLVGVLADLPGVNRIRLHQISLIGIGAVTMFLPTVGSYPILLLCTLVMGVFDGMFFPVLGPIAYQLCGPEGATQAIGCFLGLVAVPVTVGPVLAGKIFDEYRSYTLPFFLAGIPAIMGAIFLGFVRTDSDYEPIPQNEERPQPDNGSLNSKTSSVVIESVKRPSEISKAPTEKRRYKYSIF